MATQRRRLSKEKLYLPCSTVTSTSWKVMRSRPTAVSSGGVWMGVRIMLMPRFTAREMKFSAMRKNSSENISTP